MTLQIFWYDFLITDFYFIFIWICSYIDYYFSVYWRYNYILIQSYSRRDLSFISYKNDHNHPCHKNQETLFELQDLNVFTQNLHVYIWHARIQNFFSKGGGGCGFRGSLIHLGVCQWEGRGLGIRWLYSVNLQCELNKFEFQGGGGGSSDPRSFRQSSMHWAFV